MDIFYGIDSVNILIFAFLISAFAGLVKGVVGFALPMVLISGLGSVTSAEVALAGIILPTLLANFWQALRQGIGPAWGSIRKFRTFLLAGLIALLISAQLVRVVPGAILLTFIGVLVTIFVTLQLFGVHLRLPPNPSRKTEAGLGIMAGFMGGMSGIWGPPTVAMLTALDTEKKEHIRVQGVIYGLGSVALVIAHLGSGVLRAQTLPLSLALIPPTMLGMGLGLYIHDRIDQKTFKTAAMTVLLFAGLNLIRRGMFG
jgi:hypothetical protein